MEKPIDWKFVECMKGAASYLCRQLSGVQLAYVQSDEISLLLVDYKTLQTQPWFDNRLQKMCSVAASTATYAFNLLFQSKFPDILVPALFDCRAFNLPKEEVVNYFVWRQQDATRNSISSLAQANFSHKQLHGKNQAGMQDMLMLEKSINWNDCPVIQKRGLCVVKVESAEQGADGKVRHLWAEDANIPIFTQDRDYIQTYVDAEEEE
jgi:tRNA(His) 5'-end guanylyltransferase